MPGYYKTTPFFISYMEDAQTCAGPDATGSPPWPAGRRATGRRPAELAALSLIGEPSNLYALLLSQQK